MTTATLEAPEQSTADITLTPGQEAAMHAYVRFLMDPNEQVFVLRGYSGTGKSTLVRTMLQRLDGIIQACQLIHVDLGSYEVKLTATTNKAAENFAYLSKREVSTIHSYLSLRVKTNWETRETYLSPSPQATVKERVLLFIDEASYIDPTLLKYIWRFTNNCKIVFIGDPAQLTPVGCADTVVFNGKYPGAELTEVMRQQGGSPITDLATKFRHMVNTGESFQFTPDGNHIQHMNQDDFENEIIREFSRPNWGYHDSKVLAYTNARVIAYNKAIRDCVKGSPEFHVGDYAVCNTYVAGNTKGGGRVKTDQTVLIKGISEPMDRYGVTGREFELDAGTFFGPASLEAWKAQEKALHSSGEYETLQHMENTFIDLRAAYSCTINKSQGSTYDRVFIDLSDVRKCRNPNTMARLLYVGVSRARHQVFLTGDIY